MSDRESSPCESFIVLPVVSLTVTTLTYCCFAEYGNLSQSYRASPVIWDHAVLFAIWRRWMCPTLTRAAR